MRRYDCIALTEFLPRSGSMHGDIGAYHIAQAPRPTGARSGFAAIALSRGLWAKNMHTHYCQYAAAVCTSELDFTYNSVSVCLLPWMDRGGIDGVLTGLDLWRSSLPQLDVVIIGEDFNTELDIESVQKALRGGWGRAPRAGAHCGWCAGICEDARRAHGHECRSPNETGKELLKTLPPDMRA